MKLIRNLRVLAVLAFFVFVTPLIRAQGVGNSASISGTVLDPVGAVVPKAIVEIHNVVSGLDRSTTTDNSGNFSFVNVPYNPYHLTVNLAGFSPYSQDVDVRSSVTVSLKINLALAGQVSNVTVEASGGDLIETESTAHTDVDRDLFDTLPLESASSSLSSLVTLSAPGVAADSNGLFHGLGDHAENSFSVDGQPITDQQSKVFSNQVPVDAIESMTVIQGAPPAEYGGKTSLVIDVTTRSGQGVTTPHGSVTSSYGTFGTADMGFNLAYGGSKWGNFISANGLDTGRFLDPPEFIVMHDEGNEENVFDRVDLQASGADSIHLNFQYTRSWFQNPNSFDQQYHPCAVGVPATSCNAAGTLIINSNTGNPLGPTDQRSQIQTFNIAPTWTHLFGSASVLTLGGFVRRDHYNYYPSGDPLADFSPDLQSATIAQDRTLLNAGVRASISYVKGVHNFKAGATVEHTFLTEDDHLGVVDPGYIAAIAGAPVSACTAVGDPGCAVASQFDLTNPLTDPTGQLFHFHGHTDIKEIGLFVEDTITKGNWSFNLGIRGDLYRGISHSSQAEPRLGIAYNIKPTDTVLRVSYARTMESPFNENLIIASTGCGITVIAELVPLAGTSCTQGNAGPITPGFRNEFHAGLQQAFGKHLVIDAEYIWKYTHNSYDFGIVAATTITFPIMWDRSKIPGFTIRANVPTWHGFTADVVMSSVAARFFLPQVAGVPVIGPAVGVFRIDHDERFNETTHLQYQPWKTGPWFGFNWRYDSGLVAGATPCLAVTATCSATTSVADGGSNTSISAGQVGLVNAITGGLLTADQVFQAGFTCNGQLIAPNPQATATQNPLAQCAATAFGSIYLKVPAPNTENDDHNPQRIQPRSLFDFSVGEDNLFRGDRYKWSARVTVINVANKEALYNFLSTFSGTHYVTPRTVTAELGFHF